MSTSMRVSGSGRQRLRPSARSAVEVKHRPAEVVPRPLVVEHELAYRLRELVALPAALAPPGGLALAFRRSGPRGLDRVGGRPELVRGDVGDARGLAGCMRGVPRRPAQVPGRAHRMTARRARLGHRDLAAGPGAGRLDRPPGARVLGPGRLEEGQDVLRARRRPEGEEPVIRIGEGPAAADRHETRVAVFREDHARHSFFCSHLPAGGPWLATPQRPSPGRKTHPDPTPTHRASKRATIPSPIIHIPHPRPVARDAAWDTRLATALRSRPTSAPPAAPPPEWGPPAGSRRVPDGRWRGDGQDALGAEGVA